MGFLQILDAANRLPIAEHRLGQIYSEGARLPDPSTFILRGIDKCSALGDWHRWHQAQEQGEESSDALRMHPFQINTQFTCFLTHGILVPEVFRRQCAIFDVRNAAMSFRPKKEFRRLTVTRQPASQLLQGVVAALGTPFQIGIKVCLQGLGAQPMLNGKLGTLDKFDDAAGRWQVKTDEGKVLKVRPQNLKRVDGENLFEHTSQLFQVIFSGEPASGPGVNKELICLAFRCALEQSDPVKPWLYNEENRTHWFNDQVEGCEDTFRATGALLGHAIANDCFLPSVFPVALYNLLLRAMSSPYVRPWSLVELAGVDSAIARSLEHLVEYEGEDINELFCLDWSGARNLCGISKDERMDYVREYVSWFFEKRSADQQHSFCEGFCEVAGRSQMVRRHVTIEQLERLICGVEQAVSVSAIRDGAVLLGWEPDEEPYIAAFWEPRAIFMDLKS